MTRQLKRAKLSAYERYDIKLDRPQTTIYKDKGSPRQRRPKMAYKVVLLFTKTKNP
jgi:hypothetical protein